MSLLIILFALELPRETPGAITVFILLQGVLYGFGLWWVMYLYVWYLLALLAWLLRRMDYAFFLGGAQRAVRPVLRRAVRGGVSVCQNARLCP